MKILLRSTIALLSATLVAGGAAFIFLDDIVDAVIQDKLPRVEAKLGHPLTYRSVELIAFETLTLKDVSIGPQQSPFSSDR